MKAMLKQVKIVPMFDFFKKNKNPDPAQAAPDTAAPQAYAAAEAELATQPSTSWAERLKTSLSKTRKQLGNQ